jgi:hypothetical protein
MIARTKLAGPALLAGMLVLFFFANRRVYGSYFQDDDLDTLGWTWTIPPIEYVKAGFSLEHSPGSLRPVGHALYRLLDMTAGLNFPAWAATIQALHAVNALLLWLLLRQFGVSEGPALAGLIVFVFHPATFDAYWRPMFVFDVLCATFSLACVLLYAQRRWVLSFVSFWLAYRSKELAVMLPAVLLLYEFTFGDRKPLRLLPFALASASFTVQAVLRNRQGAPPEYTLHFSWEALAKTSRFYFYRMFRNFAIGGALVASAFALRDRRLAFAVPAALLFLAPLLFLPNRMLPVYVYLSLAFIGLQVALLADRRQWSRLAAPAIMLLVWVPVTWSRLHDYEQRELAGAGMNRLWVTTVGDFVRSSPETRDFVVDGRPSSMAAWGARGALTYFTRKGDIRLASADSAEGRLLLEGNDVGLLVWDERARTLQVVHRRK